METVEILAGGEFAYAVNKLDLTSAKCTYRHRPPTGSYREEYQVWLLSKEDFDNLCAIDEDDWKENWGWWRFATGSNMGKVNHEFIIHGHKIMAWDGINRKRFSQRKYDDILTYFCEELGASTEKNVCALAVDLAKQNNMTLSELFAKYLG